MEVLDSPNFAPLVQNYSNSANLPLPQEYPTYFALVQSSSLATFLLSLLVITPSALSPFTFRGKGIAIPRQICYTVYATQVNSAIYRRSVFIFGKNAFSLFVILLWIANLCGASGVMRFSCVQLRLCALFY